jgi:DNA-binding NtrC family response regulator
MMSRPRKILFALIKAAVKAGVIKEDQLSKEAMATLTRASWLGNVRELANFIALAVF